MRTYKLKKCKNIHGIHFWPVGQRLLVVTGWEVRGIDTLFWLDLASGQSMIRNDVRAEHYVVPRDGSRFIAGGSYYYRENSPLRWASLPELNEWHPIRTRAGLVTEASMDSPYLFALATNPHGDLLAVSDGVNSPERGHPQEIRHCLSVVRVDTFEVVAAIPHMRMIGEIAISPDGSRMAASGGVDGDPRITMWELSRGKEVWEFEPEGTRTRRMTFAPDGRLVVANARKVYVLPPDQPQHPLELAGHKGQVNAVAFAPDGERLLSASQDGEIRIWNSRSGELLTTFDWGVGAVRAIAFSPDGLTCAAGGEKGQVVIWDVDE